MELFVVSFSLTEKSNLLLFATNNTSAMRRGQSTIDDVALSSVEPTVLCACYMNYRGKGGCCEYANLLCCYQIDHFGNVSLRHGCIHSIYQGCSVLDFARRTKTKPMESKRNQFVSVEINNFL
jgi:hypothetical protein